MKKRSLLLIITVGLLLSFLLMLNGCFKKPDKPNQPVEPNQPVQPNDPDGEENGEISVIELEDLRVQLLSNTIVRIENKGQKGFEDRPSYIVPNRERYGKTVEFTVEKAGGETVIKTASYTVHIPDGGSAEDAYITGPAGDRLWTYSDAGRTDTNVYLPSPSDELKSWYFTDSPRIIPSEYGYSYNDDTVSLQDWDFDNDALDVFVFLPGGDYTQFCSDYTRVTGSSEMVSLQTLGYWDSRWYPYSSDTAIEQIIDYMDRGYSIDVMVIDTDWRASMSSGQGSGGIGYDINTSLFPDMAGFLQECEDLGVDICFNDHPEPVKGTTNGLDEKEVQYRGDKLTLILSLGVDYWWYDRNWSVSLNSCDPDISTYAFGMYAYQWITSEYRDSVVDWGEFAERSLIMANVDGVLHGKWYYASDLSAHRYSIQWTGDIGANSDALAQEIYTAVFGGAEVGLPYISSDIGGHNAPVTNEMYARWIQYGALSTICRVHCTSEKYIHQEGRMPWLFGETAEEVAHTYLDMRYRLLPLYYYLARENYDNGLPIMQRLDVQYPQYVEASRNDQYLLGDYILVAPIDETDSMVPKDVLSYTENGVTYQGLIAEYYTNDSWSGDPAFTRAESNVYYDWGKKGPDCIDLVDYYSVKWTGNITIGDKDALLTFFADDAIVVYIDGVKVIDGINVYDTYLSTPVYKANSTHTIEIRYAEYGYDAHVYMTYVPQGDSYCYNTRTVFIPDGTWIDVWSGERFVGPATYSVTHPLETSPIFVREGALVALAPNMINTSDKDWSQMVLDVYPSKNYSAETTLYEDDTKTDAYKAGYYRTTDITMNYDSKVEALIIKIGAAKGEFEGDRAFTDRKWTVRLHKNPDWGSVTSVVINGQVVNFDYISKSVDGVPFAFEGASCDGDIYEFQLNGSINTEYEIKVFYESSVPSKTNTSYEKEEIPFDIYFDEAGDGVDFSDSTVDWISYGENKGTFKKADDGLDCFSETSSYDTPWLGDGGLVKIFEDGAISSTSLTSQKDFSFEINTSKEANYYIIYLGGYSSTAKLTVRDRAGNVKTINFGNIDGSYTKRVIIKTSGTEGKLYVTYSMVASEYTKNIYNNNSHDIVCYLSMYAAVACTKIPEHLEFKDDGVNIEASSSVDASGTADLTQVGDLDWMHFGSSVDIVQKSTGSILSSAIFGTPYKFSDYKMGLSYSDGLEQASISGSTSGTCSADNILLTLSLTPDVKRIILYTGAWSASNTISIYSAGGKLLATSESFAAGSTAINKIVSFDVDVSENSTVTIKIVNPGSNGNVSLCGVAVSSKKSGDSEGESTGALTVNYLKLDGTSLGSDVIDSYTLPCTINVKSFSGLVPSHDYVIIKDENASKVINVYYSELDTWDGTTVSQSLSGSGTASDPYLIQSGADLAYIDQNMTAAENFKGVYFKMTKSIDLGNRSVKIGAYPGWSGRIMFCGIFDGNNCTIRNLNMTESGMGAGLFSVVTGTVKNLSVYGSVTGNDKMSGGIVGWLYNGTLENCTSYVNVTSTGSAETGGICGTCQTANITRCANYGSVNGVASVGGIAGMASGILTSCRNYGTISGTSSFNDIYGSVHSSGTPTLIDCGVETKFFISDGSVSDPTDYDYSFAIIGDQQCMVQYARELNSDKNFKLIYDYIINNAESKKIAHVFNLGDIVQTTYEYEPTSTDTHKARMDAEAKFAYEQIARLDGVVDYSLIRGNHDGPIFYEEYFGINSTYTGYSSQIEDYYINSTNSVHFFSAGELDYMVITLDFGAGDSVIEWANEIITAHPNHNVIIATHAYLHKDGNLLANNTLCARKPDGTNDPLYNTAMGTTANNGDDLWNKLVKKHANIVMVLSGHVGTEDVVCTQLQGDQGNTVTNILINPQDMDTLYKSQGGVGAVAMFYFSDGGKTVEVRYFSTVQNGYIKTENQYKFTINTIPKQN